MPNLTLQHLESYKFLKLGKMADSCVIFYFYNKGIMNKNSILFGVAAETAFARLSEPAEWAGP